MDSYNILFLCVGRRVELVNCFKRAAKRLNLKSLLIGADTDETAPALYFLDKFYMFPPIASPDYIDSIINVCNQENIALIVPTIDTDLLILAHNRKKIEAETNAKVLISDARVVEICINKIGLQYFFEDNGFKVPHMYSEDELDKPQNLDFPLFIKPITGSSSNNAFRVNNVDDLNLFRKIIKHYIVQDYMEGEEYTIDVFLDFNSKIINIVPRLRMAIRSGESSKGRIIKDREIMDEVERLIILLRPIGLITVQCKKTKKGVEFIEINPRFGGAAPMSVMAGADFCENLYRLLMGEKLEYNEQYKDNLLFLRFDDCICLNEKMELVKIHD